MPGRTKRAERVDVADRVEADPAQAARRIVAQPVRHPAVRRLVQRDRGHHRQRPDREAFGRARPDRSCDGAGQQRRPAALRPRSGSNGSIGLCGQARHARRRAGPAATLPAAAPPAARPGCRRSGRGRTGRDRSRPSSAASARSAGVARERLHREIVAEQQALHAELAADDAGDHLARGRGRAIRVERGIDDMRGHRERQIAQAPRPARNRCRAARPAAASTTGSARWLSTTARP